MATYLVTGAAGFIGSNLCRALIADGHAVRGIDNFSTGRHENIADLDDLDLREGDINDAAALAEVTEGVDYVLHQAAIPSVPRSVADPLRSHHACSTGTLAVFDAARRATSVKRVVYASSSSVYGDTPVLPKVETMATRPKSPYAVAKLTNELYAKSYFDLFGFESVGLRYFNVFGPHQDPTSDYAAVIPKFVTRLLKDEAPPVFGDGEQTRDFTYIGNVIEANLKACSAPNVGGEVFNIACGERIDLLAVIREINARLGKDIAPVFAPPRPGDVRDSVADIEKAKKLLGYTGAISFAEGLERSIEWYAANL